MMSGAGNPADQLCIGSKEQGSEGGSLQSPGMLRPTLQATRSSLDSIGRHAEQGRAHVNSVC